VHPVRGVACGKMREHESPTRFATSAGTTTSAEAEVAIRNGLERVEATSGSGVPADGRPSVGGKFLFAGGQKLYVKGVTYGTFAPDANGDEFPSEVVVRQDFEGMADAGVNAVRVYTPPPTWFLDAAAESGLRVMVGLGAERTAGYLADRKGAPDLRRLIQTGVRRNAGHPAILCYAIGNEIPGSFVRWLGPRRLERHIERLYEAVKDIDADGLVTYVNYPTTEYLELPFLDLVGFNVYLETQDRLDAYLARLQNLAGDRPLLMTEIGLDSARNGRATQADVVGWQLRSAFGAGCAGAFVYAWTDEWYRGGEDVRDWDFGLTQRDRSPKPALAAVVREFELCPPRPSSAPRVSVIVCTYNGSRTIAETMDALGNLAYPDYEVIVVDDGSTDGVAEIASRYDCKVIRTENLGLSHARNVGLDAASGEIVAYIDDDAYPDPDWLSYLVRTFEEGGYAAVGGPNIPPAEDGLIADCVAGAPGGPIHVLLDDRLAEHLPGCNMAFRAGILREVGGFDPQFCVAGDDVDVCWRLVASGHQLGFSPAAMVWHHRRGSVRDYLRQQRNYGRAEALLERKWPEKYNAVGYVSWHGRLYNHGSLQRLLSRTGRIYHGTWGSAPFQRVYERSPMLLGHLLAMPEWYAITAALAVISALGVLWTPLLAAIPLLGLALGALLFLAVAATVRVDSRRRRRWDRFRFRALCIFLHLAQPLARLRGRTQLGLHPLRQRGETRSALPRQRTLAIWREKWVSADRRLEAIRDACRRRGMRVWDGGPYERWDLEVRGGILAAARLLMAVEEHGAGCQLVRFRVWPVVSRIGWGAVVAPAALGGAALLSGAWVAGGIICGIGLLFVAVALREAATAQVTLLRSAESPPEEAAPRLEAELLQAARRASARRAASSG
jgi:GT2 family glycosyltransferase